MKKRVLNRITAAFLAISAIFAFSFIITSAAPSPLPTKLEKPFAEGPILITSAGQSADVHMVYVSACKIGLECIDNPLMEEKDVDISRFKTVIFAIGGSIKGLNAAGINQYQELERCMEIVHKAKDACSIIVVHIGGKARRGALSDSFIKEITPFSDFIIVLQGGDDDGLFAKMARDGNIPMEIIKNVTEISAALKKAFK